MTGNVVSDPWRMRCPECGSSAVQLNVQVKPDGLVRDPEVTYLDTGPGVEAYKKPSRCYCNVCCTGFEKPIDAKTGERVKV